MDNCIQKDYGLVWKIIDHIYSQEENIPSLNTGLKYDRPKLPNEIHELVRAMFSLRLQNSSPSDDDYILRYNKTNKLISYALNALLQRKTKANNM